MCAGTTIPQFFLIAQRNLCQTLGMKIARVSCDEILFSTLASRKRDLSDSAKKTLITNTPDELNTVPN